MHILDHFKFAPCSNSYCVLQGFLRKTRLMKSATQRFTILDTMSSILYPGRLTLLLGPPGAGKTTLLNALSGRLHNSSHVDVRTLASFALHLAVKTRTLDSTTF